MPRIWIAVSSIGLDHLNFEENPPTKNKKTKKGTKSKKNGDEEPTDDEDEECSGSDSDKSRSDKSEVSGDDEDSDEEDLICEVSTSPYFVCCHWFISYCYSDRTIPLEATR